MPNNRYYLGANDEHGVNPPTDGKRTPVMPYLNRRIYENECCFVNRFLRDFKKFSKLFLFSGF